MKVIFRFEGCFIREHNTARAQTCKYNGPGDIVIFETAMLLYSKEAHPENYGKFNIVFLNGKLIIPPKYILSASGIWLG